MARTKLIRDLGSLPPPPNLGAGDNKTGNLKQILRSLAVKNQREQPRVFYSLREVANQFQVPISAVSRVYDDMEAEGLLSRVRASKTILNGLRYNRRRVRAAIGLPALLSTFIAISDYRTFLNSIRRELWMRGFSTNMVFYKPEEAADGSLTDQFKSYEIDAVIWLHPGRSAKAAFLRLADMGIRMATISAVGTPTLPSRYYLWRDSAIIALLSGWKSKNPQCSVTVIDSKEYRSPVTEELLRIVLEGLQIETTIRTFRNQPANKFLRDLRRLKTDGIIFPSAGLAAMFSFQNAPELTSLIKSQRVAFIDGPIDVAFSQVPDASVDLITFDWKAVSETIVNDLVTLEAFDRNLHTTFEAQAQLRVPLSKFSETIRPYRSIALGL